MQDIAEFLSTHSPFDSLDEETLVGVASSAEIEFHAARTSILDRADATAEFAHVVRRGSVELVVDGHLLDLMEEGEMFGFVSLPSEGPLGFVAPTVRRLTGARWDVRAWRLWHGPGGLRSG